MDELREATVPAKSRLVCECRDGSIREDRLDRGHRASRRRAKIRHVCGDAAAEPYGRNGTNPSTSPERGFAQPVRCSIPKDGARPDAVIVEPAHIAHCTE